MPSINLIGLDGRRSFIGVLLTLGLMLSVACAASQSIGQDVEGAKVPGTAVTVSEKLFTIGDISDEPIKKIERFKPLADYLASELSEFGYAGGNVVIARDVEELAKFIDEGEIDLYMDSPYPVLNVQTLAQTQFILRRWKDGDSSYNSVFVAITDDLDGSIDMLSGSVVAAEDVFSTSGYALPVSHLIANGFDIEIVRGAESSVPEGSVGIWFTRDKGNTFDVLANGIARFAIMSNRDLEEAPEELIERLVVIGNTGPVPRQIVSTSPLLSTSVISELSSLLVQLGDTPEGLELLAHVRTTEFDLIPDEDQATLSEFANKLPAIP